MLAMARAMSLNAVLGLAAPTVDQDVIAALKHEISELR